MKNLILGILILLLFCSKKSEEQAELPTSKSDPVSNSPAMERKSSDGEAEDALEESDTRGGLNEGRKQKDKLEDGIIDRPLDPISEASKSRLLEYTIQLNYKVDSIEKAREILLGVIKKESYIASSDTNLSDGTENMHLQIQVPVFAMYDTLLQMDKIGQLTYESIRTQDWSLHNELQKIKLSREALRMVRRSRAANKGSAETWNWKDREEALERSEDNADSAKLESWKIKDNVAWAKVIITVSGKELPAKIQFPNYKNALVSAVNLLFELSYFLVWLIPLGILGYLIFKGYRFIRR